MPKINKKTIKHISKCETLKIFKFENSSKYYYSFYVGTQLTRSGNKEKSTKLTTEREAIKFAKETFYKYWKNHKDDTTPITYDFDKNIAQPFFTLRRKKYLRKGTEEYSNKEMNMYTNYIMPFLQPINYNETDILTSAIEDFVYDMKQRVVNGQKIKDTTISKYANLISLMCKYGQNKGLMKALPDIPTFSRINADRPPYYPAELKKISNEFKNYYQKTEDEFWLDMNDYVSLLRNFGTGRTGVNNVNLKVSQFEIVNDEDNPDQPILYVTLYDTKNKKKQDGSVHNYWTNHHYFQMLRKNKLDKFDHMFFPKVKDRTRLYEKVRKNFKRVSSELGLYVRNGNTRPMYSIRHMVADKRYTETQSIHIVAEHISSNANVVKSNYLSKNRELRIRRHKTIYPELYSTKSKNKIETK
jgi:hypothetical protein